MKLQYILLLLLLCTPVLALDSITDFVHDEADILNASLEAELRDVLGGMAREGVVEMAVVTINSLEGESKEEYALRLAHDKLGDKEEDNGLLLLIALEEQEYRVEVGYGLEGVLNDAKVGRFAREFLVPSFKEGKYDEGVAIFTNA
ncbi:MAG: TPM domain-containing protein, partial [Candidatus Nanoarchaeia archaeon]